MNQKHRIWSVDIVRGIYIFLMMTAHSIFFFHAKTNPLLQSINGFADAVTFTGLFVLSGVTGYIAYIHRDHPAVSIVKRVAKRILIYLLGYYILSILADSINHGFSLEHAFDIIFFRHLVPFTEFILPFLLLGILKVPFRSLYEVISRSLPLTLVVGLTATIASVIVSQQNLIYLPDSWQAILVGLPGVYSFPVFSYLIAYLIGVYIGRMYWHYHTKAERMTVLRNLTVITGVTSALLAVVGMLTDFYNPLTSFERWPPTLPFILFGIAVATAVMWLIEALSNLQNNPLSRNILVVFGQNAFALFFTHTLIIYLYRASGFPLIHSSILVFTLYVASILLALYLARVLPLNYRLTLTFFKWCDCQVGSCTHAREHRLVLTLKRILLTSLNLPKLLSFKIGRRRITPLKVRHSLIFIGFFFLTAAPLGIAENQLIVGNLFTQIQGKVNRTWVIPEQTQQITYTITLPESIDPSLVQFVQYQINQDVPQTMSAFGGTWTATIPVDTLNPAEYRLEALITTTNNSRYTSQPTAVNITEPVYVAWTIDWEGYDVPNSHLDALIAVSETYQVPMTHYFNPRIYTAPDIGATRSAYLTQWVINRRDLYQEEIGLHLHMFKDFVNSAGVEPKDSPYWQDGSGYDILTTAYTTEELIAIIKHAKDWFHRKDLGTPLSYRAGGWFANTATLKALETTGFYVDSSARTKYAFGSKNVPGFWDVDVTQNPYFPSQFNQNHSSPAPQFSVMEIPNNGADDYAFTAQAMIDRFDTNYPGGIISSPVQITFLSHPEWFNKERQAKITQLLDHINQFTYLEDKGPVIYTTTLGIYRAFVDR